jgi:hypothetical protein
MALQVESRPPSDICTGYFQISSGTAVFTSKVVAEIVSNLLELGLELSDDTVRRHLKEAAELLPPPSAPERQRGK